MNRDIRGNADKGNHGRHCRKQPGIVIACGNKIGDAVDPVGLLYPDQSPQYGPPEKSPDGRADKQRQKKHAGCGRKPDTAVIGPGRTVYGQGKGIDDCVIPPVDPFGGLFFHPCGDKNQQTDIKADDKYNGRSGKHVYKSLLPSASSVVRARNRRFESINKMPMVIAQMKKR